MEHKVGKVKATTPTIELFTVERELMPYKLKANGSSGRHPFNILTEEIYDTSTD